LSGKLTYLEAAPLASSAASVLRNIPFRSEGCPERDDDAHRGGESRAGCAQPDGHLSDADRLLFEKLDLRSQVVDIR
jgi:hypothetical protein